MPIPYPETNLMPIPQPEINLDREVAAKKLKNSKYNPLVRSCPSQEKR